MKNKRQKIRVIEANHYRLSRYHKRWESKIKYKVDKIPFLYKPKNGIYQVLCGVFWKSYLSFNDEYFYIGNTDFELFEVIERFNLLPNLREKEWDALKLVGYEKLSFRWQSILKARNIQDYEKSVKRMYALRRLKQRCKVSIAPN